MPPAATDILLPSSFFVEGYRAFRTRATVPLRPLTLLYGPNSAGKSSLLRFLVALGDALRMRGPGELPFRLGMEDDPPGMFPWEGAKFADLAWSGQSEFSFGLQVGALSARWDLFSNIAPPVTDATPRGGWADHGIEQLTVDTGDGKARTILPTQAVPFYGLLPGSEPFVNTLRHALYDQTTWVQRWRGATPRTISQRSPGSSPLHFDIAAALRTLQFDLGEAGFTFINQFFGKLEGEPQLNFAVAGPDNIPVQVQRVHPATNETRLTFLTDEGDGLSQVLPALVAAFRGAQGIRPLVCLEQPELHIHPRAQRYLADALISLHERPNPLRLLIETHSENMLLAVQLALIEQRIRPEDVALCWVGPATDGRGSELRLANLDASGRDRTRTFPRGVFTEDNEIAQAIIHARMARGIR